jgi:hypothetical protein
VNPLNDKLLLMAGCAPFSATVRRGHRLDDPVKFPLGAVYRLDGRVLLLGCGYNSNTSLHLAEWRQESPPASPGGSAGHFLTVQPCEERKTCTPAHQFQIRRPQPRFVIAIAAGPY